MVPVFMRAGDGNVLVDGPIGTTSVIKVVPLALVRLELQILEAE